jgi:hypothetical protein
VIIPSMPTVPVLCPRVVATQLAIARPLRRREHVEREQVVVEMRATGVLPA